MLGLDLGFELFRSEQRLCSMRSIFLNTFLKNSVLDQFDINAVCLHDMSVLKVVGYNTGSKDPIGTMSSPQTMGPLFPTAHQCLYQKPG